MKVPIVKTPLPGPKSAEWIEMNARFVSPSYTRVNPPVVQKAEGLWVEDADGNLFLDFTASIAVTSTVHCHPRVVEAIPNQAGKLIHMSGIRNAFKKGLLLLGCGENTIRFCPALSVSSREIDTGLSIFHEVFRQVAD